MLCGSHASTNYKFNLNQTQQRSTKVVVKLQRKKNMKSFKINDIPFKTTDIHRYGVRESKLY